MKPTTSSTRSDAEDGAIRSDEQHAARVDNHYEHKSDLKQTSISMTQHDEHELSSEIPSALTSEAFTGLQLGEVKSAAGGVPAVVSSMQHVWREAGTARGSKTLLKLNQKGGFDCRGCAWPAPDGHRSHSEFCENGAKAVAEEATTARVTPKFFAQHSVAELAQQSDFLAGKTRMNHASDGFTRLERNLEYSI